jgi:hypothetical protein
MADDEQKNTPYKTGKLTFEKGKSGGRWMSEDGCSYERGSEGVST